MIQNQGGTRHCNGIHKSLKFRKVRVASSLWVNCQEIYVQEGNETAEKLDFTTAIYVYFKPSAILGNKFIKTNYAFSFKITLRIAMINYASELIVSNLKRFHFKTYFVSHSISNKSSITLF